MDPAYVRAVSLHLSRVLDEIGLNKVTIGHRRRTFLYNEHVLNTLIHLRGREATKYHFGSQTEGSTTPGLDSDLDTLICTDDFNAIEDWSAWQQGKENLLMLQEKTAPGYCRLQQLRSDIPMVTKCVHDEDRIFDDRGRVLLKNTIANIPIQGVKTIRNGPARSRSRTETIDQDDVFAIPCRSWPVQAEQFTRRQRRHDWPTRRLIRESVKHGVFLVPVGYKLSPTEPLEWRISASLAERCLMFSLSTVHIKCYVVLKMLMKTFVDPYIRKCISSYHCKTAVLYCTESSEARFWCEDNLIQCVQQCLAILLVWVTEEFCPHFIIQDENLFAGKVTAQNRDLLRSILTSLVKCKGRSLLSVCIDDLGHKLQTKLITEPSNAPVLQSLAIVQLIGHLEDGFHSRIHSIAINLFRDERQKDPVATGYSAQQRIVILRERLRQANKLERQAILGYIEFLSCWLGSLLASIALSRKMRVPRIAIKLLRIGSKSDISSALKLASIYYSSGDLHKVEKVLQRLEAHFCRNEIKSVCSCYDSRFKIMLTFCHMLFVLRGRRACAGLFAHCVRFSRQEIHCAPPAIRSELFRAVGNDVNDRHPYDDKWMILAVVDCLPYLYYLQYLTYRQLEKRDLQARALYNLERCFISECEMFGHPETALNLIGQCKEMEHELETAMGYYMISLMKKPRNNAANWHMAILCYKAFLRQSGT